MAARRACCNGRAGARTVRMTEPLPDTITIVDKYGPAMAIADQAEADAYFERLVEHAMRRSKVGRAEAEANERSNLGCFAGYLDDEKALQEGLRAGRRAAELAGGKDTS